MLWIAFKLLSLWRQKQRGEEGERNDRRCELLSNYYLCDVRSNKFRFIMKTRPVVNCFQIIIFVTSEATSSNKSRQPTMLWIAFKLLSLWRQKQLPCDIWFKSMCCELLSNYYLCDVRSNTIAAKARLNWVVNCFQIIIFVTSEATYFATSQNAIGCELLSNYYLCDVRSNRCRYRWWQMQVVNCFQIIIFVTSEATLVISVCDW